jgi:putative ABC transport system permease protein
MIGDIMSIALQTLWHERSRYLGGVLSVTFAAVLIALQCGLLLGLFKITSIPIDNTTADIWVGSTAVKSVDLGKPIPTSYLTRIAGLPGVKMPEQYIANFATLTKPSGGTELCFLLGSLLDDGAAGAATMLTQEQRAALTMPDAIIMDESKVEELKLKSSGGKPKINGKEVTVVGTVKGLQSLAAPWVFCSLYTARHLMGFLLPPDHVSYILARCESPRRAKEVAEELRNQYGSDMMTYTAEEFSTGSRVYWLRRTKAGIAIGFAAFLGLLVGAVITAQTLYSATRANAKELAILLALGIPRWRISVMVLMQSFWVGIAGLLMAVPVCLVLWYLASQFNTDIDFRWEVLAGTTAVTLGMAVISGLIALRSVRQIEPMDLLR